ncbi:CGP-CTERM-anchored Cys-rich protein [Pyrococcus sp. NA2]|uniref:CGP-CTERM-anchored Cys-rich protein n=1 Tax=Pyrococcus sp. (strain NA2) TaxID=342949 RepID=UPI000AAC6E1C|nr:CGP-CTERM-anchored Cys-rich protein [Pyrococcus sp. NA2]
MKRIIPILFLLLLVPRANACFFPQDTYAVEVELSNYNLEPLFHMRNIIIEGDKVIYRSHYDSRLIVMIWNDSKLHVRIQIPTEFKSEKIYVNEFTAIIPIEIILEKAEAKGWNIEGYHFYKDNVSVFAFPESGKECKTDADCKIQGCSGELCVSKNETVFSTCIYKEWYKCLKLTTCGCYNGYCTWKPTKPFIECLKNHNVSIENIVGVRTHVRIEVKGKLTNQTLKEISELFGCNTSRKFREITREAIVPKIDPKELNASIAISEELKWLRSIGVIKINDNDIREISNIARWGYAGYNARIGFYDGKWKPYFNASNATLVRCIGTNFREYEEKLPKDPPSKGTCGIGLLALISLIVALGGRRREDTDDILGGGGFTSDKGKSC